MRNIAVSIVLAVACLLVEATGARLSADPDHGADSYAVGILSADTSCPAATHSTRTCPEYPTEVYLDFDKQKGRPNSMEGFYVVAIGTVDYEACAPIPLIHVTKIERAVAIPFCVPPGP
jgi:hypothetical protein